MGRVLKINTGIIGFIKKKTQKIYHFYLAKTCRFSSSNSFSDEEMKLLDEIAHYEPVVPDFDPSSTVLFTTEYTETKLNKKAVLLFRYKIKKECLWLLELGYTDFIISYGSNYGIIALKELIYLSKEFGFNLYYCKVMRENANCIAEFDLYEMMFECNKNGVQFIGMHFPNDFIKKIILKVSMISCERGAIKTSQKLPQNIYEHFKKKEQ